MLQRTNDISIQTRPKTGIFLTRMKISCARKTIPDPITSFQGNQIPNHMPRNTKIHAQKHDRMFLTIQIKRRRKSRGKGIIPEAQTALPTEKKPGDATLSLSKIPLTQFYYCDIFGVA